MNPREERERLRLNRAEAARRAEVSLPTLRKFEADPESVTPRSAAKCKRALEELAAMSRQEAVEPAPPGSLAKVAEAWENGILTPRQAYALAVTLSSWADVDLEDWLEGRTGGPLHRVIPFAYFDLRVMMLVDDNTAFAAKAIERCLAVDDEIEKGILPFDRDGCFFDEVLMGAALRGAEELYGAQPELFYDIPARPSLDARVLEEMDDDDEIPLADDDWEDVGEAFDSGARWDDWEVPVRIGHRLLPLILEIRHPFRWFDVHGPRPTMRELVRERFGVSDKQLTEGLGCTFSPEEEGHGQNGDEQRLNRGA
jgi:hypothetical protein